nr:lytic transglycosylase domain-containing protein [Sphingobium sp. KCTC 72723]
MFAFPVHSLEARTTRQNTIDEQIVATCIARSAAGRGWLAKTLWGLRDQEGGWIGAEVANSDGSHDLGPLQVNSWWVPRLATITGRPERHVRHWLKQDACFNVEAARWIFLSGLATTRDYWKAIGVYHSPTGWRQQRYTSSVLVHLRRRFGASLFARPSKGLSPVSVTTP